MHHHNQVKIEILLFIFSLVFITSCNRLDKQSTIKEKQPISQSSPIVNTMDSRDLLIGNIIDGIDTTQIGDNSNKSILSRGCDPEMGRRAIKLLPPVLGNPEMVSVTNDDDFITELQRKKWSVILFAPGACRYDATKLPIPGSRLQTKGWGLAEYRSLVRKHQGEDINIVETTDERQIVPLLRKALEICKES